MSLTINWQLNITTAAKVFVKISDGKHPNRVSTIAVSFEFKFC